MELTVDREDRIYTNMPDSLSRRFKPHKNPELYTVGFVSPSGEIVERIPLVLGNDTVIPFRLDSSRISPSFLSTVTPGYGEGGKYHEKRGEHPLP